MLRLLLSLSLLAALSVQARPLPAADELVSLPGGAWLALGKAGVQLLDAGGTVRAEWPLRGESLDARPDGNGAVGLVVDANTQRVLPLRVDLQRFTLTALPALPEAGQSVSAACLYRATQGHLHAFVVGKNGVVQQFVLRGDEALPVRRLAVAPDAAHCQADDAGQRLLVSDDSGVWAHRAEPEGTPRREPVALRRPHGPLAEGGGPVAVLAGGVAIADAGSQSVLLMAQRGGGWKRAGRVPLPAGIDAERMVATGPDALAVRADGGQRWSTLTVPAALATPPARSEPELPFVLPRVQTDPVAQFGDAADDPAIWVHPGDRSRSLVLATDKKRGVGVYDLGGRERQFLALGRVNNIDVRQDVQVGSERMDIAAATQRDDLSVVLLRIGAQGEVSELVRLPTAMEDIYGICLYRSPRAELEIFVNDKSGRFLHLRVGASDGRVLGTRLREFSLASQPEGCVADDARGRLFIGEEKRGVWSLAAQAGAGGAPDLKMILPVGRWLHADVEGLGLYHGAAGSYLVVSSQGNDSFVVLDAAPPYRVRGAFRVGMNLGARIDGASETDGLDVSSLDFGGAFGRGLLVVQDGFKVLPEGPQNFKIVAWDDVARALQLD
jgi:3-phytase